jgi:pimeloyl-ACP methyl ester carboxylesterase
MRRPVSISVADPTTATEKQVDFSAMHLAVALRLHSYSDDTASLLPFLIHEAAQGRPQALAAQTLLVSRDLNEQLANGMHNAVVCTEDVPFITTEDLNDPEIERSYLRRTFVETLQAMCSVWPKGVIDPDFHTPLTSDVPALLLSGENDPVTPASYGERAAHGFKHSKHLIVPGQGHGQLNNPCLSRVISHFIEQTSSDSLDTRCVAKQAAAPFMLNATSPGP